MEIESPDNISPCLMESLVVTTLSTSQMLLFCFILLNIFSKNNLDSFYIIKITFF